MFTTNTKSIVLFNALTLVEHRNQGYHQDLLKYFQNNFIKKKIVIYVESTKPESLKASKKINFKKIGQIKKLIKIFIFFFFKSEIKLFN